MSFCHEGGTRGRPSLDTSKEQLSFVSEHAFKVKDISCMERVLELWKENGNLWTQQIRNNDTKCHYIPLISRVFGPYCKLRTGFFPSIYGPSASTEKNSVRNLQYGPKNEANKMFIIWLLPVWGTGNKCRTHDLTVIWQASKKKVFIGARKQ